MGEDHRDLTEGPSDICQIQMTLNLFRSTQSGGLNLVVGL